MATPLRHGRSSIASSQSAGSGVPTLLEAVTARAEGEVLLAEGKPREALRALRTAIGLWRELDAPYDAARVRVAIAPACRLLGDSETAKLETTAARRVFEALGAAPAWQNWTATTAPSHGLSPREVEVLRHLAGGRTNARSRTSSGSASGPWTGT